jgi:putative membrane protein
MSNHRVPGLQAERTALAWQRTAAGLLLGAVVVGRLTAGPLGRTALVATGAVVVLAGWLVVAGARRRLRRLRTTGGSAPALLVTAVVGLAGVELCALMVR